MQPRTHILAGAMLLALAQPALANIDIQFDYSYDSNNFFLGNNDRISVLDAAASVFETRFADSLSAIVSSGGNDFSTIFFNPSDPNGADLTVSNASIGADVIRIYVGSASLGSGTLGLGGPGGYSCSGFGSFCTDAASRGQGTVTGPTATDFSTWGGAISFNSASNWYFGSTTGGLNSGMADFYSVAVHELAHVLGFGTADSFVNYVDGSFYGPASTAVYGGAVPLGDEAHWLNGTQSLVNGATQEAAMDPTITLGQRKHFTDLDFAAMKDIGWQVTAVPEADTWAMLLAGLGLVGFAARRRLA
ncbi:MAG: PEPxxWA-CTERM sorting domain-containing protein [Thiobacillus sp.]|nr:PEPxxWA-CTERM sorting domain-containing protein [Thiobacillus sp.]